MIAGCGGSSSSTSLLITASNSSSKAQELHITLFESDTEVLYSELHLLPQGSESGSIDNIELLRGVDIGDELRVAVDLGEDSFDTYTNIEETGQNQIVVEINPGDTISFE